jgi:hypothetical protein
MTGFKYYFSFQVDALLAMSPITSVHGPGCSRLQRVISNDVSIRENLVVGLVRLFIDVDHHVIGTNFNDKIMVVQILSQIR